MPNISDNLAGFKQTDVGLIPDDWDVVDLGSLGEPLIGLTYAPSNIREHGTLVLRASNIQNGRLSLEDSVFVEMDIPERAIVRDRDLLICVRNGSRQLIGKCLLLDRSVEGSAFGAFMSVIRSDQSHFIYHQFQSDVVQRQIAEVMGATINQLTNKNLREFVIPVPNNNAERKAISEALSDVDDLIESLEQLIAKKRLIKQGTMQALLSGKKRLPGFDGEWESRPFGEIAKVVKSFVDPRTLNSSVPCVELEHLDQGSGLLLAYTDPTLQASFKIEFSKNDVLFGKLRPYLRKFLYAEFDGVCSSEIWVLRPLHSNLARFVYYLVQSDPFIDVVNLTTGTKMPRADWRLVKLAEFKIPSTSEEQQAIAAVLADMDSEMESLETQIVKARTIKHGMMQQLLTGKIRLVPEQSTVIPFKPKDAAAKSTSKGHNLHFNEAVVISVLTSKFSSLEYPLGRKRRTKLQYLLHRHCEGEAEGFLKKAAGPYNPATRYKGAEAIAIKNGYVKEHRHGRRQGFIAGDKSTDARPYFDKWYGTEVIDWLEQFRFTKNDDLELLTTVDMAIVELCENGSEVSLESVKRLIHSEPEWAPKLNRSIFSDDNIQKAVARSLNLFGED